MKKYRFFYHYYKQKRCMSVHFRGKCILVDNVECMQPTNTKWNKTQPYLVVQGFATDVAVNKENTALIL